MGDRSAEGGDDDPAGDPVVTRMNEVKFKRMVQPGDELEISAEHLETKMGASFMRGSVKVGGKVAASLEFAVMISERT